MIKFFGVACALFAPAVAQAATVVPTAAVASSHYAGFDQQYAIDQGGNAANTDWVANSTGAGSYIDLAFGGSFTLSGARVVDRVTNGSAQGNGFFAGGLTDYTTSFSLQAISGLGGTLLGSAQVFNFAVPTGPTTYASFTHNVTLNPLDAQFVRYTVLATQGPRPGLADISFVTSPVPEPATWAMMMLGFGGMGYAMRRKAKVNTRVRFA